MTTITSLPLELFIDEILPILPINDLLSLMRTSRFFANLGSDDTFWRRKLVTDYNFSGQRTARTTGFKTIYKGIRRPKVFVWGQGDSGRLGLGRGDPRKKVAYPIELKVGDEDAGIVDLAAAGWSFTALDSKGRLLVWGKLDSGWAHDQDHFARKEVESPSPVRLDLGPAVRIKHISCGRNFNIALDSNGQVWQFLSWGRPHLLVTHLFDRSSEDSRIVQIEAGWSFCSALTASGDVYIWAPTNKAVYDQIKANDEKMNEQGGKMNAPLKGGVVKCATWQLQFEPLGLPHLPPDLPALKQGSEGHGKLVKIAAADGFLIGLTSEGHVLKIDLSGVADEQGLVDLKTKFERKLIAWEYLPLYSDVQEVSKLPGFAGKELAGMEITHVSAHFKSFVAYSTGASSIVLLGHPQDDNHASSTPTPTIIPSLQNRSVISIVLGDYHFGALTEDGQFLTWGSYSNGALGLGDPAKIPVGQPGGFADANDLEKAQRGWHVVLPGTDTPTPVRFDWGLKERKQRFAFAATAAGWHCGALVIDLDDGGVEEAGKGREERKVGTSRPVDSQPPAGYPTYLNDPGIVPSPIRGGIPIRFGLAAAGRVPRNGGPFTGGRGGPASEL